jgi:coenzyme F420 hydrogenase subunit beta
MRQPANLREIVENGLCIGCGLCQSIAGADRVEMVMVDPPGRLRPKIKQSLDQNTEEAILAGCPGARIDEPVDAARHGSDDKVDPSFGPRRHVWRGHAANPEVHHLASSGGALTALGIHLLETDKVEFILHVTASREKPMRTERHLSFDRAQVIEGAGSRYGPASPLIDFTEQLA